MTHTTTRRAVVDSFDELLARPFADGVNALCWPRALEGDFDEVARCFAPDDGVVVVDVDMLRAADLSAAGRVAADVMVDDLVRLQSLGREPILNCIAAYARDERGHAIAADVLSFHVDRAPVEVDTWLCTYAGAPGEGLDNDDAVARINDPAVRAALVRDFGGVDDSAFDDVIFNESFDLHYAAVAAAVPFSFGVFALWKIAVAWPGALVPPCIHRAPQQDPGDAPRLLLIC